MSDEVTSTKRRKPKEGSEPLTKVEKRDKSLKVSDPSKIRKSGPSVISTDTGVVSQPTIEPAIEITEGTRDLSLLLG